MTRPLKLTRAGTLTLGESDVTKQCIDWLQLVAKFTCVRLHVGTFKSLDNERTIEIGQEGDPDWLVFKYACTPLCRLFYLELKTAGGTVSKIQQAKHDVLRKDGYLVCVARGLDELQTWMGEHSMFVDINNNRWMLMNQK